MKKPLYTSRRVGVITPTIGNPLLRQCVESVNTQTYESHEHFVVVDGRQHIARVEQVLGDLVDSVTLIILPDSTGGNHYFGHRIYGAVPFIINTDYVAFLDEDNWLEPGHLSSLMTVCRAQELDWAYALRRIVSHQGNFICNDNCESLGLWGAWCNGQNMVDTSCYLLRRAVAVEASFIWHRQGYSTSECDPDKALCRWLMAHKIKGFTSGDYSVNYRLGSTDDSVIIDYFVDGNALMDTMYNYFPWQKPELEIVHEKIDYRRIYTQCEKQYFSPLKWSGKNLLAAQGSSD